MDENRKKLYDQLSANYDMGTFDEFDTDLDNEDNQKVAWEAMGGQDGYGDFSMFQQAIARSPQAEEARQAEPAVTQPDATNPGAAPMMDAQQSDWTTTATAMPGEDDADADISLPDADKPTTPKDEPAGDEEIVNEPAGAAVVPAGDETVETEGVEPVRYDFTGKDADGAIETINSLDDDNKRFNAYYDYSEQKMRSGQQQAATGLATAKPMQQAMTAPSWSGRYNTLVQEVSDGTGGMTSPLKRGMERHYDRYNQNIDQARGMTDEQLRTRIDQLMTADYGREGDEMRAVDVVPLVQELMARQNGGHAQTVGERIADEYLSSHPELAEEYRKWQRSEAGYDSNTFEATPLTLIDMVKKEIDRRVKVANRLDAQRNIIPTDPVTERSNAVSRGIDITSAYNITDALRSAERVYGTNRFESYVVAFAAKHNMTVPQARERVRELVTMSVAQDIIGALEPGSNAEYVLRKALTDNMVMNLARAGMTLASGAKPGDVGLFDMEDKAMAQYEQTHTSGWDQFWQVVATTSSFVVEGLGGGGFVIPGIVGKAVSNVAMKTLSRAGGGLFWKRLVAGSLGGAANFGAFESQMEAVRQLKTGERNPDAVWHSLASGLAKGAGFGAVGESIGRLFWHSRGWMVPVGEVVKLAGETATFSAIGYLETGQLTPKDWATNFGMALGSKLTNPVQYIADVKKRMDGGFGPKVQSISDAYRDELSQKGYGALAKVLHDGVLAQEDIGRVRDELSRMRSDNDVPMQTLQLAEFALNGRVLPCAPATGYRSTHQADGTWTLTPLDPSGRPLGESITVKGTDAKNAAEREMKRQIEKNAVTLSEYSSRGADVTRAVGKAVMSYCDTSGEDPMAVYSVYQEALRKSGNNESLGEVERQILDAVGRRLDSTTRIDNGIESYKRTSREAGYDIDKILDKPVAERTAGERKALDEYKTWLGDREEQAHSDNIADFAEWVQRSDETAAANSARIAREYEQRAEELRGHVEELRGRLDMGNVVVLENIDQVENAGVRRQIEQAERKGERGVPGWYDESTDTTYVYLPHAESIEDLDRTIMHEQVTHHGLRVLKTQSYNDLCDRVWNSMSDAERGRWENYPGVKDIDDQTKRQRAAADEYIANLAERTDPESAGLWRRFVAWAKEGMRSLGIRTDRISDAELEQIIRESYRNLREQRGEQAERVAEGEPEHVHEDKPDDGVVPPDDGGTPPPDAGETPPAAEGGETPAGGEPPVERPTAAVGRVDGTPADLEDWRELMTLDPDELDSSQVTEGLSLLEAEREQAHRYANGELAEEPSNWEYWAARDGLSAPENPGGTPPVGGGGEPPVDGGGRTLARPKVRPAEPKRKSSLPKVKQNEPRLPEQSGEPMQEPERPTLSDKPLNELTADELDGEITRLMEYFDGGGQDADGSLDRRLSELYAEQSRREAEVNEPAAPVGDDAPAETESRPTEPATAEPAGAATADATSGEQRGETVAQVDEDAERRAAQEADPYYMPMENKGGGRMSPNWRKATAEQIFNHLNDRENESGRGTLDGNIADGVKRAEDKLKAVERREPKGKGRSDAALDKWEKELSEARTQLEKWREVERMRREQKAAEGDDSDPTWKQAYDEFNSSDEEPVNLEDYVARHLYGTKFKWKDKEFENTGGRTHGLGGHLGLSKSDKERRGFFGWIDEKNGSYPESVAEGLYANMPDWMRERYDTMEVLDAVLSVVGSNPRPRDMVVDYVKRLREQNRDMDEYYADEAAGARGFHDAGEMDAYDNMREREAAGFHDGAAAGRAADGARADLLADAQARLNDPNASEYEKQAARTVLRFRQRGGRGGVAAQGTEDDGLRFRVVRDPREVERLERGKKVKRYRAMQLIDGKLYPPMSARVNGQLREPTELGVWEQADENPELARNGKFRLDKGQRGQGTVDAAYNPYFHTSTSAMNDQFSSAWKRPELVVVEVEIPESELTSGYRAEGAKDAVGDTDWKSGSVNNALPADRQRTVTLSRWMKAVRIVPDAEVADMIARQLDGTDISIPFNVVNENLRNELVKRGVKIGEPEKSNAGRASRAAYEQWRNETESDGVRMRHRAPNGEESRLDERQYDEVRTGNFKRWFGDWENNPENASKVVDKNGEPLVVYHQTNSKQYINRETGQNWDDLDWRERDEWDRRSDEEWNDVWKEQDFYTFDNRNARQSVEYPGFFFSPRYDEHHEYGDRTIAAYLDMKNPAIDPDIPNAGVTDTAGRDAMESLMRQGYDGVIRTEDGVPYEYIVFRPEQIKSATENNGDFSRENGDIRFRFVGERGAANQDAADGGKRMRNKEIAEAMERGGKDARAIKLATGWERGKDGKWRHEERDFDLYQYPDAERRDLEDIISEDDSLFDAYPELRYYGVLARDLGYDTGGSFNASTKTITINSRLLPKDNDIYSVKLEKNKQIRDSILHEVQHAIQSLEGFAKGGAVARQIDIDYTRDRLKSEIERLELMLESDQEHIERARELIRRSDEAIAKNPHDKRYVKAEREATRWEREGLPLWEANQRDMEHELEMKKAELSEVEGITPTEFDEYRRLAGEVEARNVSKRMKMTDEQRRQSLAEDTEDVARDEQIVRFGNGVSAMGSRVDKRMAEIGRLLEGRDMTDEQRKVADVFSGKSDKSILEIEKDGSVITIELMLGGENKAGSKHAVFRHYDTREGYFTSDDILVIPEIVKNGERTIDGRKASYTLDKDGVKYTFATERKGSSERMVTFYTDRKAPAMSSQNTSKDARTDTADALIGGKGSENSADGQMDGGETTGNGVNFRVRGGASGESADHTTADHTTAVEDARRRLESADASEFERIAARAVIKAYGGGSDDTPDGGGVRFRTRDDADMLVDMTKHNNEVARQRRDAVTDFVKAITDVDELTDSKFATALGKVMRGQRQYDQATVADITTMVKAMMDAGLLTELDNFSVKQILTKVKDSTGKNDITAEANKLIDIMLKHQLKKGKQELDKSLKVTGQRVDSRGVVVQAGLDPHGQLMVAAFKEGMKLDEQQLDEQIAKAQNDMSSSNQPLAADAAGRYDGLLLARQHLLDIRKSEADEVLLKNQLTEAKELHKAGMINDATYKQLVESINDQLRDNKFERIEAYNNLQSALGYGVTQSVEASKQWRESNAKRVGEIQHNANSDLEGVPTSEFSDPSRLGRFSNNIILRFLNSSLPTFDFMLRFFGSKNVRGEGYLFNRFMRGDNGYIKSSDRAARGEAEAMDALSKKASELFGKKMRFVALGSLDRKLPKVSVEFLDGGEMKPHELTQGQVVYMYMVNKMADGRQKLRAMGITQEAVDSAVSHVDQRLVKLADWIQDEFNEQLHNKYNAVHQRVFGSPLTHIANYFPLRVNPRSRLVTVDNANDGADGNNRPSTITGGIIKRTRNSYALDLPHNSFVDVMQQHISEMEHWAAFAEFNRDINTLLSYKNFRNKVANMTSFRYGSGNRLLEKFEKVAALAGGGYRPAVKESSIDNIVTNIVKGLTVNKIAFRLHTALKQLESGIVYLSEANPADIMNNMLNLSGSWNWAIENLPGFTRRWVSRTSGDYRLRHSELDWKVFNQGFIEKLNRWGMTPNAFVDAMTVAVGARSIYDSRFAVYFKDYLDSGWSQEDAYAKAHDKALMDATTSFNETQQSSEEAFVSTIQADRTVASAALTAFRNASMGYQRRLGQAYANLARRLRKGYKEQSIEFMTKQGIRDGLSADVAERAAKRAYRNGTFRDIADVALFGFFVQFGWNMMNNMYYQIFGDDDEEKKEARVDAAWHSLYGGQIEGLAGGNILSDLIHMKSTGQNVGSYNFALLPFVSDMQSMLRKTDGSNPRYIEAATDAINILIGSGTGVNPQVLTDAIVAGFDACEGDLVAFHETMWFLSRLLQVPQSEQKKFLVDRIGKEGADGKPLSLEQVASRYGRYVMRRNAPLGSLAYDGEQEIELEKRYAKQIEDAARKRDERLNDEEFAQKLRELEDKGLDTKGYWKDFNKRAGVDSDYGKPDKDASAQARLYYDLETYEDHAGDVAVRRRKAKVEEWGKGRKEKGLKRKGDKWHYAKDADRKAAKEYFDQHRSELEALAKIEYYESEADKLKKKLVAEGADQKDIMRQIRELRNKILAATAELK